jgi:hypothetical protein
MPANAMLVHELENNALGSKMENTTSESNKATNNMSQPQLFNPANDFSAAAGGQMVNNPPGMYGGMGMYNIPPPGVVHSGLASMPPGQFPLDTGVNNPSNTQLNRHQPVNPTSQLDQAGQQQQQVPYGMQPSSLNTNAGVASSSDAPNAGGAGGGASNNMPSGMSMQYPNPAYMYTPAGGIPQFNQMGHPAYGMQAAAYGYGQQFAPQGQYGGYNQGLMGQGGGYGAPSHYDDQRGGGRGGGNARDDHQGGGGGGGYNKGGGRGGYRGNRNHHQNSHGSAYANNYQTNPNMGGYGGGPYNMGYGHGGGYGNPGAPSGMDHYGMQQQQQGGGGYGGFSHQDNDHKKSGINQQGGGLQQQSHLHQQPLGLQGSSADTNTGGASGGWPSRQQNWGGDWQQEN